jgi:hypothetical protein
MVNPFALVLGLIHAQQSCDLGSQCTQGTPLNISNSTGACVHNPFYPGTKVCEVCSDCHTKYPSCPCCNPVYDDPEACALCLVDDAYALAKCGNHPVSYNCDKTEELDPCVAKPGKGGTYQTLAECRSKCAFSYSCFNQNTCQKAATGSTGPFANMTSCKKGCHPPLVPTFNCVAPNYTCEEAAPGTKGQYSNVSQCHASCKAPPCKGSLTPSECGHWQSFYDALNGPHWARCSDKRDDPCACILGSGEIFVTCTDGHITQL